MKLERKGKMKMNNTLSNEEIYELIRKAMKIISTLIEEIKVTDEEASYLNISLLAMCDVLLSQYEKL